MNILKKILFNKMNMKKAEYYKISLKDVKLITELQIKLYYNEICFYPPCLTEVIGNNYCHLHNKRYDIITN